MDVNEKRTWSACKTVAIAIKYADLRRFRQQQQSFRAKDYPASEPSSLSCSVANVLFVCFSLLELDQWDFWCWVCFCSLLFLKPKVRLSDSRLNQTHHFRTILPITVELMSKMYTRKCKKQSGMFFFYFSSYAPTCLLSVFSYECFIA